VTLGVLFAHTKYIWNKVGYSLVPRPEPFN
jgi:hypothetical protein